MWQIAEGILDNFDLDEESLSYKFFEARKCFQALRCIIRLKNLVRIKEEKVASVGERLASVELDSRA